MGCKESDTTEGLSLHFQEISPESRLDWSLQCHLAFLPCSQPKPTQLHFQGLHLPHWTENPAWFKQADRQAEEDSQADNFSQVSGRAPGPQQELVLSSALVHRRRLCHDWSRKATKPPRPTSRPSHFCSLTLPGPTPSGRTRNPLPLDSCIGPALGPDWSLPQSLANHGGQGGWNTPIGQVQVM